MDTDWALRLGVGAAVLVGLWTLLSANAGRRAARWGRRWIRRLAALGLLLLAGVWWLR
ncbi:MAG: hypothetical protein ACE5IL_13885 [Myxococcota bacterium]